MDRTHHIYLVPGFLGFEHLEELTYFGHVRRLLSERLTAAGHERLHTRRLDVTAAAAVELLVKNVEAEHGPIERVYNAEGFRAAAGSEPPPDGSSNPQPLSGPGC